MLQRIFPARLPFGLILDTVGSNWQSVVVAGGHNGEFNCGCRDRIRPHLTNMSRNKSLLQLDFNGSLSQCVPRDAFVECVISETKFQKVNLNRPAKQLAKRTKELQLKKIAYILVIVEFPFTGFLL